jgi:hypothetical protein
MSKPKRKRKSESAIVAEILARWEMPLVTKPAAEKPREQEAPKKRSRGGGA